MMPDQPESDKIAVLPGSMEPQLEVMASAQRSVEGIDDKSGVPRSCPARSARSAVTCSPPLCASLAVMAVLGGSMIGALVWSARVRYTADAARRGRAVAVSAPGSAHRALRSQRAEGGRGLTGCYTVTQNDECHNHVEWAMREGIYSNPGWYHGLSPSSSFEEFQMSLHLSPHVDCPRPCLSNDIGAESTHGADCDNSTSGLAGCDGPSRPQGGHDWPPRPDPPYTNNYNASNPLGIKADTSKRSNNYLLIIGDWGKHAGVGACQMEVAHKMKAYVERQKAAGKTLLAVTTTGDNFYWTGATQDGWHSQWEPAYGSMHDWQGPLHQVPWLAVMGNHDYGDNDPYAFCPETQPLASINGQAYASHQMNRDRNPTRPAEAWMYWFPDYNYHYEIPEADVEIIAVDTNYQNVVHHLGWTALGFQDAFYKCGYPGTVERFMKRIEAAGEQLLRDRAWYGTAKTTIILQHYPESCKKDVFYSALRPGRQTKVLCAFGHWHDQKCHGWDERGVCTDILAGGGGGCCGYHWAGFAAVHLTDDGSFDTDVYSDEVRLPHWQCHWRRRV